MSFFGGDQSNSVNKRKYEHLTLSIKQTVLERSHHRCQKCSAKFRSDIQPHFEHINGSLKDNRPVNLRALCQQCFKSVEEKENRKGMFGKMRNSLEAIFGK
ncbi:MAG TPA: hypothetical protein VE244_17305 [Nitrososphaeraceae archaeon]|jgi:5-methylcytosine-specific restriction protein A|nr:hypothetical protein [Nitrososphaeraceae archaeon]